MSPASEAVPARDRRSSPAVHGISDERTYLHEIIQTIGSGPDLETILRGVVRLVTEATACHACFVYFTEETTLRLRAASAMYAHLEGQVSIPIGEGLTGWVARTRRSAFIGEHALEDPRVRRAYFPELGDEHYQSLVSVPVFARAGDVIGVITLHATAPHEFARQDLDFLEHTASLVAGAAENARLYEDAQERIALLTDLSALAQTIASSAGTDELLGAVVDGCRRSLEAARCEIFLIDHSERLTLRAASPARDEASSFDTRRLWLDALRGGRGTLGPNDSQHLAEAIWGPAIDGVPMFEPLVVADEVLGVLALLAERPVRDGQSVLSAIASHTAVAIKQHEVIDWLKETHRVKDFFESLAHGHDPLEEISAQAASLSFELDAPHLALHMASWTDPVSGPRRRPGRGPRAGQDEPIPWQELALRMESALGPRFPGALFDRREGSVRALIPLGTLTATDAVESIRATHAELVGTPLGPLTVGLSDPCRGAVSFRSGFEEAASAAEVGSMIRGGPGVATYEDLGPYRYVLTSEEGVRDRYQEHLERLVEYDRKRDARLLESLETYLDHRGNVVATSRALYIHPNTLRQRLGRVRRVAGLDLDREDWLSLAIAIKVVKLRQMRRTRRAEGEPADG